MFFTRSVTTCSMQPIDFSPRETAFSRIKQFYGTSENAVKTQILISISVYVLVAIVKKHLKTEATLYTILQILSLTIFEKTPLDQLLTNFEMQEATSKNDNQLNLFN